MKYILKLNERKVQEARAKMHESYKGLLAITLTNEGTKENPAFRVHCLENGIKDLGLWDADRILRQATKVGYNVPSYFGILENCDGTPATNETASRSNKLYFMKSVVGLISRISGYKVIRINELV